MIGERLIALREQRATLIAHASQQRATLDAGLTRLDGLTPWLAYLNKGARYVKARPWWLLGAVALVVAMRPRRSFSWITRGFTLWRLWRRAQPLILRWRTFMASST